MACSHSSDATFSAAAAATAFAASDGALSASASEVKKAQSDGGALDVSKTGRSESGQTRMPASKSVCILDQSACKDGRRRLQSASALRKLATRRRAAMPASVARMYLRLWLINSTKLYAGCPLAARWRLARVDSAPRSLANCCCCGLLKGACARAHASKHDRSGRCVLRHA